MLYVQQSLAPGEEILMGARFHWMYTVRAVLWIFFGVIAGLGIGYGAIWWEVSQAIQHTYQADLPPHIYQQAWAQTIAQRGGYVHILWALPPALRLGMLACFLFGLFLYAHLMIVRATTEIAVTNQRVIYKRGLIARHVGELGIDRIEGVSVDQGVWGRIWGYGDIIIRGMGIGEVILPQYIDNPIEVRKAIQEARVHDKNGTVPRNPALPAQEEF